MHRAHAQHRPDPSDIMHLVQARMGRDAFISTVAVALRRRSITPMAVAKAAIQDLDPQSASIPTIAAILDAAHHSDAWQGHPYHGRTHHALVALGVWVLSRHLDTPTRITLLIAALLHDMDYDPQRAGHDFAQERIAARATIRCVQRHPGTPINTEALGAIILATYPAIRDTVVYGGPFTERLDALSSHPDWLEMARILVDADLMGSLGLGAAIAAQHTHLLEAETGMHLWPQGWTTWARSHPTWAHAATSSVLGMPGTP